MADAEWQPEPYPKGSVDCQLPPRFDKWCDNDGLCCHDATDPLHCPWTQGEYGWAGEDRSIVSQFKRDRKESCLAHEVNYMEAMEAWEATWIPEERERWAHRHDPLPMVESGEVA